MAATALPASAGLPTPRSPTLSDFGMILPEADPVRSQSPIPAVERPPSPSSLMYTHANRSEHTIRLASSLPDRRASPHIKAQPLSSQSSRSTLRTMGESDGSSKSSKKSSFRDDALASSPTLNDAVSGNPIANWDYQQQQRRVSDGSSSVHSDDIEALKWPGFDSHNSFDDSGLVLEEEDEEGHHQFPVGGNENEETENDRWLDGPEDADEDMFSSAALSRRAEIILANAKKRLNVMEGNLRGARQSLVISPTFRLELPQQLASSRDRDRRLYAGMGPIPPKARPYQSSPLSANNSPGHWRVLSETSVPLPNSPVNFSKALPNKRASSAMGMGSGPWSPEGYGQGRFPIRESRSFEVMRERPNALAAPDERDHSLRSHSRGSRSPPHALETLPEDDDDDEHHLRRSSSAATDLRSQMNDLKGRISSLKLRAQEDSLRRRSMQSLRTPSPFTSAEIWYGGVDTYKSGTSPITADAGIGTKIESPVRKSLYGEEQDGSTTPKLPSQENDVAGEASEHYTYEEYDGQSDKDYSASHYEDAREPPLEVAERARDDEEVSDDPDFVSVQDQDLEPSGDSVYEDAVYEMPVAERHEDRVDAFDYEHFFLHSAMGTYSQTSRRSSSSSADSVATTRPVTAILSPLVVEEASKRISMHQRNNSVDSVSTVATFATAAEEHEDEDENEEMEQFSKHILPVQHPNTQRHTIHAMPNGNSIGTNSVMQHKTNGSPSQTSEASALRGSSPSTDIASGLQTSKIFSILTESPARSQPRLALNDEEKELIYSLAASFQQVCARLQSTSGDQYERKEWRRRLDEARRTLNGEETEGQPF